MTALPVYQSVAWLMFNSCQASRSTELIKAGKLQDAFAAVTRCWIDGAKPLSVSVPPPDLVESDPYRACCQLLCGGILKCKGEELLWPASLLIHKCFWSPREYLTHTHHTHVFISLAITFWSVQFTGRIARGGIR